ncbi:hypothetical protein [Thalassoglobus sp.]|uniref:hypothetical protein n=1 Tax=Thalassoglobus sp. TaxID=2795869 RepID=UPI003AA913E0
MIRAAFLTMGLYLSLCGAGLFVVDQVALTKKFSATDSAIIKLTTTLSDGGVRIFNPPEWMAFTCIGVGGVTMLYAVALPKKASR